MDIKAYKSKFDALKSERANWDNLYQVLGEFISQVKQNFTSQPSSGEFLTGEIYDSTGTFAAHSAASAITGMLWPSTAKQAIEIVPPDDLEITTDLSIWYNKVTERTARAIDDPAANFTLAYSEYMQDQVIFGTSGVGCERGDVSKLMFKPYGVKEMYIDEGKNGLVDTVYLFFDWTVARLVREYGIENVSEKAAKLYNSGKTSQKVKVLICIGQREAPKAEKGVLAMPYESIHIEYDTNHLLRESGFADLPIKVGRFSKLSYEIYGRSMAMMALPDIREANVLREGIIVATEKNLDMPKGVMDDGLLGGGVIDTTSGAITVFNASQSLGNQPPIFEIGRPPDVSAALARLEDLKNTISQHFNLDRLIDFNNDTQMTFGEAQIRAQIRNSSLSSLYNRQDAEVLTPTLNRAVNILMEDGEFGVIKGSEQELQFKRLGKKIEYMPDIIAARIEAGEDIYKINYKTKAAAAARAEEYMAILDVLGFSIQAMQVDPSIRHRVDLHKGVQEISNIRSIPVGIMRQDDEVERRIAEEQEQMRTQQQLEAGVQAAGIVDSLASANKSIGV